eukprot:365553-Chlamydomonas_euryale.AAC.5
MEDMRGRASERVLQEVQELHRRLLLAACSGRRRRFAAAASSNGSPSVGQQTSRCLCDPRLFCRHLY